MIYEYRTYKISKDKMDEFIKRFRDHTIRLFLKHKINFLISSYDKTNNIFKYVVSFSSKEEKEICWKSFMEDKERARIWEESNKEGKLVESIESRTLEAIFFKESSS